jgi:putative cardiolipin synthase
LVDGVAAVLGGRNIGDEYFGQDPSFNFQDMDAIALGEVAAEAGEAFDLFWNAELAVQSASEPNHYRGTNGAVGGGA